MFDRHPGKSTRTQDASQAFGQPQAAHAVPGVGKSTLVEAAQAGGNPHPTGNVLGEWEYDAGLHYKVWSSAHLDNNKYGYHLKAEDSATGGGTAYKLAGNSGEYWFIYINQQPNALTGKGSFRIDAHNTKSQLQLRYAGYGVEGPPRVIDSTHIFSSAKWHITYPGYIDMWLDVRGWIMPHRDTGILGFLEDLVHWFDSNVLEPIIDDILKPIGDFFSKHWNDISNGILAAADAMSIVSKFLPPPYDVIGSAAAGAISAGIHASRGEWSSAIGSLAFNLPKFTKAFQLAHKSEKEAGALAKAVATLKNKVNALHGTLAARLPQVEEYTQQLSSVKQHVSKIWDETTKLRKTVSAINSGQDGIRRLIDVAR
jgi:hypothetical protein